MSQVYKSYQHQSQNFDPAKAGEYTLSLFLHPGLLIFSILSGEGKILAVKEFRSQKPMALLDLLEEAVNTEKFLNEKYASVRIIFGGSSFSIVPEDLELEKIKSEYAGLLLAEKDGLIQASEIGLDNAKAVYTIPKALKSKLDSLFGNPIYTPYCRSTIQMGSQLAQNKSDLILLHFIENHFILTALKNGKLQLCNAYKFVEIADIVYYLQLATQVTRMNAKEVNVSIAGEFEQESQLISQLRKFIPNLEIPGAALQQTFDMQSEKLPTWKYAFLSY